MIACVRQKFARDCIVRIIVEQNIIRRCGILLPVASLPGSRGIGGLGPAAIRWLEFLCDCGQTIWQILPLNPIDGENSPYQSSSVHGREPLLLSLEALRDIGLLSANELEEVADDGGNRIDYNFLRQRKMPLLERAAKRFLAAGGDAFFGQFCCNEATWLEDHALFQVLSEKFSPASWVDWPEPIRDRDEKTLEQLRLRFADELAVRRVWQYFFHCQWEAVRRRAADLRILIFGDVPIFVSHCSADVWANRELFDLDANGRQLTVAGVPPDYFSKTGQRWGNPLYRWSVHKKTNYRWWAERLQRSLRQCDVLRLDHFRAFADYWEIPASEQFAVNGRWIAGPGEDFFHTIGSQLGPLPLVAEDLGILSDSAIALREKLSLPGLRVLLFAFDAYQPNSPFLPENYVENCVAYTGTHDNDTLYGTFFCDGVASKRRRLLLGEFLPKCYHSLPIHHALMRWIADSAARWMVVPMQDAICLGSSARTNLPGTAAGNWCWRLQEKDLAHADRKFLRSLRP
ncbi:MAG: 4-alpha-glucanotransferase [Puniceicoccales bacterium]|jgi:4-alpha-glucanotransferase|nr:4-alpha-glucanotransferase [Puniceicoccales bacterium]